LFRRPRQLLRFFAALDAGADVVVGSRNIRGGAISGWGVGRRFLSKGGSAYSRVVLGVSTRDLTTGYKAFTRLALERLRLESCCLERLRLPNRDDFRALRAGMQVVEVPIHLRRSARGPVENGSPDFSRSHQRGLAVTLRRAQTKALTPRSELTTWG